MIPSRPQLDADYAAIEGRIVCWLAGQEDALQEYRDGVDRYVTMAAHIYSKRPEAVNKFPERFVGKQAVLGCGYQMSGTKFVQTCWKMGKYKISLEDANRAVKAFRRKHDKLVRYWYAVEEAAQKAILNKGKICPERNISFLHTNIEGMPFLLLKLPSGRKLAYPRPKLVPSRFEGKLAIQFYGNIKGSTWGYVDTYGGKLVENITQAVAGDILMHGVANLERAGYEPHSLIHDQCLAYYHPGRGQNVEEYVRLLTDLPEWATGLPLAAEGDLIPFYKKDS